ncbi:hypothetical protein AB1Y20_002611 [Prymnesium parvum]|uniref:J domain-containing protein n=1 Tax=Prymnesium parvum TaxID=97485 RepID=A0AB34J9K7_PRYPA
MDQGGGQCSHAEVEGAAHDASERAAREAPEPSRSRERAAAAPPPRGEPAGCRPIKKPIPGANHLLDGIYNGAVSVASSVAMGGMALVGAPIVGAREAGVRGAAMGAVAGVTAAVTLPVLGGAVAVGQLLGGAANTPSALRAMAEGKEWDEVQQQYALYSLHEEHARLCTHAGAEPAEADAPPRAHAPPVADLSLYATLGVRPDASGAALKKAYHKRSLEEHPDKHPEKGPHAFQEVARAYQVLSNPESRAAYDATGEAALHGAPPSAGEAHSMFELLFGLADFEPYVGALRTAEMLKGGRSDGAGAMGARVQAGRQVALAMRLANRIHSLASGAVDRELFCVEHAVEARRLCTNQTAEKVVQLIGECYVSTTSLHLSRQSVATAGSRAALSLEAAAHSASARWSTFRAAAAAAQSSAGLERTLNFVEVLWALTQADVDETISQVVHKLLSDRDVSDALLARRAQALLVIGRIYKATVAPPSYQERVLTKAAGELHGIAFGRGVHGECVVEAYMSSEPDERIRPGDVLVQVGGQPVVGYNHAVSLQPRLLEPTRALPQQLCLTLRSHSEAASVSWREHMRQQLQEWRALMMSGDPETAGPEEEKEKEKEKEKSDSWAATAGRPGESGYRFGDMTRTAARRTGQFLRPLASRFLGDGVEAALPRADAPLDLAGWLGKRSDHVGQWRHRYFRLAGGCVSWSRRVDEPPHGAAALKGANVWADDFECEMPFSMIIAVDEPGHREGRRCLYLTAGSHAEREKWTLALQLSIESAIDAPASDGHVATT